MIKFLRDLFANANGPKPPLTPSTVKFMLLVVVAGRWADNGIHPSWCIAFVVLAASTDRLLEIALLLMDIWKLQLKQELENKRVQCIVEAELKLRGATEMFGEEPKVPDASVNASSCQA